MLFNLFCTFLQDFDAKINKNKAKKGKIRAYYQTLDDTGLADLETGESTYKCL